MTELPLQLIQTVFVLEKCNIKLEGSPEGEYVT